jgi:hypothetical protein
MTHVTDWLMLSPPECGLQHHREAVEDLNQLGVNTTLCDLYERGISAIRYMGRRSEKLPDFVNMLMDASVDELDTGICPSLVYETMLTYVEMTYYELLEPLIYYNLEHKRLTIHEVTDAGLLVEVL